jgi:hypothetical protein
MEIPIMIEILAISAGWIWNPPGSGIHAFAPLTSLATPGMRTKIKPRTPAAQIKGV